MEISWLAFAAALRGPLFGMLTSTHSARASFDRGSKDVVNLGRGLIVTMFALVLCLLIASAKDCYDMQRTEITQMSTDNMPLDPVLAHYGRRQRNDTHNGSSLV